MAFLMLPIITVLFFLGVGVRPGSSRRLYPARACRAAWKPRPTCRHNRRWSSVRLAWLQLARRRA